MTPTFRPFVPADVEELMSMMRELFEGDGATFNERQARAGLASIAATDPRGFTPRRVWLIEEGGRAAGYLVLTFAFSLEFGGWHGFIDELFLRDGYRGRGWGTRGFREHRRRLMRLELS